MSIKLAETMSSGELEKILKHLPEPDYVDVYLFGDFDYSGISSQVSKVVEDIKLTEGELLSFRLENSTKEKILEIYKKSEELIKKDITKRRIDLKEACWYLSDLSFGHNEIKLTPAEVSITYNRHIPKENYKVIKKLINEVEKTEVRLSIIVNK